MPDGNPLHALIRFLIVGEKAALSYHLAEKEYRQALGLQPKSDHCGLACVPIFPPADQPNPPSEEELERACNEAESAHQAFVASVDSEGGSEALVCRVLASMTNLPGNALRLIEKAGDFLERLASEGPERSGEAAQELSYQDFASCIKREDGTRPPKPLLTQLKRLAAKCGQPWCGNLEKCECVKEERQTEQEEKSGTPVRDKKDLENAAVALLLDANFGSNISKIARELGIPRTTLRDWPRFKEALARVSTPRHGRRGLKGKNGVDGIVGDDD